MGKTSSIVKDRYNAKAYDEIKVRVFKGQKEQIKSAADSLGETVNTFIGKSIEERIQRTVPDSGYTFNPKKDNEKDEPQ